MNRTMEIKTVNSNTGKEKMLTNGKIPLDLIMSVTGNSGITFTAKQDFIVMAIKDYFRNTRSEDYIIYPDQKMVITIGSEVEAINQMDLPY